MPYFSSGYLDAMACPQHPPPLPPRSPLCMLLCIPHNLCYCPDELAVSSLTSPELQVWNYTQRSMPVAEFRATKGQRILDFVWFFRQPMDNTDGPLSDEAQLREELRQYVGRTMLVDREAISAMVHALGSGSAIGRLAPAHRIQATGKPGASVEGRPGKRTGAFPVSQPKDHHYHKGNRMRRKPTPHTVQSGPAMEARSSSSKGNRRRATGREENEMREQSDEEQDGRGRLRRGRTMLAGQVKDHGHGSRGRSGGRSAGHGSRDGSGSRRGGAVDSLSPTRAGSPVMSDDEVTSAGDMDEQPITEDMITAWLQARRSSGSLFTIDACNTIGVHCMRNAVVNHRTMAPGGLAVSVSQVGWCSMEIGTLKEGVCRRRKDNRKHKAPAYSRLTDWSRIKGVDNRMRRSSVGVDR